MDLNQLAGFIDKKRKEFEREIGKSAKKLRLQDVAREIKLDMLEIAQREFKYGQKLDFLLCQGNYTTSVDRKELVLRSSYGVQVAKFSGHKVKKFYDGLSTKIMKAKEEDDVPF